MMRECTEHGYFRDEYCPVCGEEGKFIMSDYELEKLGRLMAGILSLVTGDSLLKPLIMLDLLKSIYLTKFTLVK